MPRSQETYLVGKVLLLPVAILLWYQNILSCHCSCCRSTGVGAVRAAADGEGGAVPVPLRVGSGASARTWTVAPGATTEVPGLLLCECISVTDERNDYLYYVPVNVSVHNTCVSECERE